jgi:hypothetical protein
MPDGIVPTAAGATYGLLMFPPKLEREVLLAQSSEKQKWSTHGIALSREHRSGTRVHSREDRLIGGREQEVRTGFLCRNLFHSLVRTGETFNGLNPQAVFFRCS